jgi:hypothetical protein
MAKVQAVNTIHRAIEPGKAATATQAAVKPKLQVIKAGEVFESTGDELKFLRDSGAVRNAPEGASVSVNAETGETAAPATSKKAPRKTAGSKGSSGENDSVGKASDEGTNANIGDGADETVDGDELI